MNKAKRIWYLVRNILLALGFGMLATVMAEGLLRFGLYLVGILLIFSAAGTIRDRGFGAGIFLFILGAAMLAGSDYLIKNVKAMDEAMKYVGSALAILLAVLQYRKVKDRYGRNTKLNILMRLLPFIYPTCLIVSSLLSMFPQILGGMTTAMTVPCSALGTIGWIAYTVMVYICMTRGGGASSSTSRNTTRGGEVADSSTVTKAMREVAAAFDGGLETVSGANIHCTTSVSVSNGEIVFRIGGKVRQTRELHSERELENMQSDIAAVISKRQKRIMDKAGARLNGLNLDRDYSVSVEMGNLDVD